MTDLPYSENDIITLKSQYKIIKLKKDIPTSWIFEGINTQTKRVIIVKIFNNSGFSNIKDVEIAWENEIESSKQKLEISNFIGDYIESGVIYETNEKYFIIIYGKKLETEKTDLDVKGIEMPLSEEISIPKMSETTIEKEFSGEGEERIEVLPEPTEEIKATDKRARSALRDSRESSRKRERLPTPSAPTSIKGKERISSSESSKEKMAIETKAKEEYLKHISMEYFDKMNPQNYYPITIELSDLEGKNIIPAINPITGERKIQTKDKMEVLLSNPRVIIRPSIPGCNIEPRELETDFTKKKEQVTFYITPIVKGKILGQINFVSEGKIIHSTELKAKVVDPRIARAIAFYGILASFIPEILSLLGINLGLSQTLSDIWSIAENTFGNLTIAGLIGISGIIPVIIISIVFRQILKPKSCKVHYKLRDFRMKDVRH